MDIDTRTATTPAPVRRQLPDEAGLRWAETPLLAYKAEGTHFDRITRQVLFGADAGLPCELRYFEIAPGGHSTLEEHAHIHAVTVLHGHGRVLVGDRVYDVGPYDLVHVPAHTWHQFRAGDDAPLGFLCLVAVERDRPRRPDEADLARLRATPEVAEFIRI